MRTSVLLVAISAFWVTAGPVANESWAASTVSSANTVVLCVYPSRSLSPETLAQAIVIGTNILADAGVTTRWIDCDAAPEACSQQVREGVIVRFTENSSRRPAECGISWRRGRRASGLISIEVACVTDLMLALQLRAHLAIHCHQVVGALLAHEIGHVLGMHHSRNGLMSSQLGQAEWRALVEGRLGFSHDECRQMAAALRHQPTATRVSR